MVGVEIFQKVTEYQLTKLFPEEFKSSLPSIEEIENELRGWYRVDIMI